MNTLLSAGLSRLAALTLMVVTAALLMTLAAALTLQYGHAAPQAVLRIDCDLDCVFSLDSTVARLSANTRESVSLAAGRHLLEVATTDGTDYWTTTITIPNGDSSPYDVHAPLTSQRAKRMARQREVRRLHDEFARKEQELNRLKATNREAAVRAAENVQVATDIIRLIQKYSARYQNELQLGNLRKQEADQLKVGATTTTTNTAGAVVNLVGNGVAIKLYSEVNRHYLCAHAAFRRIDQLTTVLGAISANRQNESARSLLQKAMTFYAAWGSYPIEFLIGDATMEIALVTKPLKSNRQDKPTVDHLSFICSDIEDVHTGGPPVIRTVNEFAGTGAFVIRLATKTLKLRATDDAARQAIVGTLYLACPSMTADSGLVFDPSMLTLVERTAWQLNQMIVANQGLTRSTIGSGAQVAGGRQSATSGVTGSATPKPADKAVRQTNQALVQKTVGHSGAKQTAPQTAGKPPATGGVYLGGDQKYEEKKGVDRDVERELSDAEVIPKKRPD